MVLEEIIKHKHVEVADRQARESLTAIRQAALASPQVRSFVPRQPTAMIAEVKRRSPSRGMLTEKLEPVKQARAYERGGASAISVLTDEQYFGGSFEDLAVVRAAVELPVLCKDFVVTPYQVYEARARGADLLLLIVAAMPESDLIELFGCIRDLGMQALVEVHDQHDLARAIAVGADLIGINNRDLTDFSVDMLTTEYLAPLIPDGITIVSESGIENRNDVERVVRAGAHVVLVGETLMRSADSAATIAELLR